MYSRNNYKIIQNKPIVVTFINKIHQLNYNVHSC